MLEFWKVVYTDDQGNPRTAEVGLDGVKSIEEHRAQGEGDKWFYDVTFSDNCGVALFNVDRAYWKKKDNPL